MPSPEPITGPRKLAEGRFELLEKLGEGGMGVVYRALDRERGVQVALKTLRGATPDSVLRFKTEFRSLRDIRHPNLVELGELFESEGMWFFTMELVRGTPLLAWIRGLVDDSGPPSTDSELRLLGDDVATRGQRRRGAHLDDDLRARASASRSCAPGRAPTRPKLRTALAGLASGLAALHAAGKVHRDVKPSNVLVDDGGRAVLLDFGVVAELRQAAFEDKLIIGTVSYMAPEQARGDAVGPAADWYALGVVLFQALTGRLPLAATSEALLVLKQHTAAPEVSRFVDAPQDLARLCMQLLERDPNERPSEAQIFELLGAPRTDHQAAWMPAATEGRLFVGRRVELGLLDAALDASTHGAVAVVVEGESGVGKTALVDHFCEVARATHKKATILRGRCHQRERVAFNAFDGIVHELARWLISRPDPKVAAIVPARVSELIAVFPDLRAVPMFAAAIAADGERTDRSSGPRDSVGVLQTPADLRDRAFMALRELLATMAHRGPIVLVIDDLQWADDDSLAALEVLLDERRAPPILVLATLRTGDLAPGLAVDTRQLALTGLAPIDAEKLLHRLASDAGVESRDEHHLIAESNGHPLFLAELVRHQSRSGAAAAARRRDLDARAPRSIPKRAGCSRRSRLRARELPRELALESSGLAAPAAEAALDRLARAQLVKIHGPRRSDPVEPFHDRVREVGARERVGRRPQEAAPRARARARGARRRRRRAVESLRSRRRPAARPPATCSSPPSKRCRASRSAVPSSSIATCSTVLNPHARQRAELLAQLADALSMTGHTAEAGKRYLEASSLVEPNSDRQLDLLRRASERFLMSGNLQPGLETARQVLARVGMSLPNSKLRTLAGIGWSQFRTRPSALVWKPRAEVDLRSLRADVCWSIAAGLAMVDSLLGAYYSGRAAVLALKYGTSFQIARSLAAATVGAALMGQRKRTQRYLEAVSPRRRRGRLADRAVVRAHDALHDRVPARSPVPALPRARDRARSRVARRRLRRGLGDRHHPPLQPRVAADARHDVRARRAGRSADDERGAHGRQVPGGLAARAVRGAPPARRQAARPRTRTSSMRSHRGSRAPSRSATRARGRCGRARA